MLLSPWHQWAIADAVFRAVAARPDCNGAFGMCHVMAAAGAQVANQILGENCFAPVYGTLLMLTSSGEWVTAIDHAWMVAANGGRLEVADLSARFYRQYAAGIGYDAAEVPPVIWTFADQWQQSSLPWRPHADERGASELVRLSRTKSVKRLVREIVAEVLEELL
jgi:hypothetical protein